MRDVASPSATLSVQFLIRWDDARVVLYMISHWWNTIIHGRMAAITAAFTVGSNGDARMWCDATRHDAINSYASRQRAYIGFAASFCFTNKLCMRIAILSLFLQQKSWNHTSKLRAGCVAILRATADIQLDAAESGTPLILMIFYLHFYETFEALLFMSSVYELFHDFNAYENINGEYIIIEICTFVYSVIY